MYPRARSTMVAASLMASAFLAVPSPAHAQEVAGSWNITWAQAVRYKDGELEIQRWGTGMLKLDVDGEHVTGTWTTSVQETVRWTVSGTFSGGRLNLVSTGHDSDNPQLAIVEEMRWRAVLGEVGLEGEMTMVIRGRDGDLRWRPWSAARAAGR